MTDQRQTRWDGFDTVAAYDQCVLVQRRFADLDALGHINNAAIAIYLEMARMERLGPLITARQEGSIGCVLAEISIRYLRELHPGDEMLRVCTMIQRVGRSSMTIMGGVFEHDICIAMARQVVVQIDEATRRSTQFDEQQLKMLASAP